MDVSSAWCLMVWGAREIVVVGFMVFMVRFVLLCCVWLDLVVQAIWCVVLLCCLFAWWVMCFDCLCLW